MPIPPFAVPDTISRDAVIALAKIFKPVKIENGKASLIKEQKDIFNRSFLWDAKYEPYTGSLYTLDKIYTVHDYGYQGMFKPSIAEVLQQIPKYYTKLKLCYFEVEPPEDAHDLNLWLEHTHAGVHVAKTTLYLPESTLDVMATYYDQHPEMRSLSGLKRDTPSVSAARWLEQMQPEERLKTLRYFCHKCGHRFNVAETPFGSDKKLLDLTLEAKETNCCPNCKTPR